MDIEEKENSETELETVEPKLCTNCQEVVQDGDNYCRCCGKPAIEHDKMHKSYQTKLGFLKAEESDALRQISYARKFLTALAIFTWIELIAIFINDEFENAEKLLGMIFCLIYFSIIVFLRKWSFKEPLPAIWSAWVLYTSFAIVTLFISTNGLIFKILISSMLAASVKAVFKYELIQKTKEVRKWNWKN